MTGELKIGTVNALRIFNDAFGLENRRPERVPEFESLRFRQTIKGLPNGSPFLFLLLVYTWYTNWYI